MYTLPTNAALSADTTRQKNFRHLTPVFRHTSIITTEYRIELLLELPARHNKKALRIGGPVCQTGEHP